MHEFLVSKMRLTTILAQLVSVLRVKLWKVVMKCKNTMLRSFLFFFLKFYIFEDVTFFLTYESSNELNFSVAVRMYEIYVFDDEFFS